MAANRTRGSHLVNGGPYTYLMYAPLMNGFQQLALYCPLRILSASSLKICNSYATCEHRRDFLPLMVYVQKDASRQFTLVMTQGPKISCVVYPAAYLVLDICCNGDLLSTASSTMYLTPISFSCRALNVFISANRLIHQTNLILQTFKTVA